MIAMCSSTAARLVLDGRGKGYLEGLQIYLPITIWTASTLSALFHPFLRWALPAYYARTVQARETARLERVQDVERGENQLELGTEVDENTPLAERGISRLNSANE